jgi:hypothetical protein
VLCRYGAVRAGPDRSVLARAMSFQVRRASVIFGNSTPT